MAFQASSNHYIAFYAGASGLRTSDFVIDFFLVDGSAVDVATRTSFTIVEVGGGYYYAKYIPSTAGLYFVGFSNVAHVVHVADTEDIQPAIAAVNLTQNTGGLNVLQPRLPIIRTRLNLKLDLSEYVLMVFESSDWQVGRTDNTYATAMTRLDVNGNWITTPLVVSPGTYHIIIRNNYGTTQTFKTFLEV